MISKKLQRFSSFCLSLTLLFILLLSGCSPKKVYKVGMLSPGKNEVYFQGFKDGLTEAGYIEGENISYIDKLAVKMDDFDLELDQMLLADVDLLYVVGTSAALKAKNKVKNSTIPVVFSAVSDPVESGVVESYIKPGGSITGVRSGGHLVKTLIWLLEIVPDTKKIWVPYHKKDKGLVQGFKSLEEAALKHTILLEIAHADTVQELEEQLKNIPPDIDAIFQLPSSFFNPHIAKMVNTAKERKLPLASGTGIFYKQGTLLAYGSDGYKMSRQASRLAVQIFNGVPPADLPVETAEFFLGINVKTADEIGLEINTEILERAHDIIR